MTYFKQIFCSLALIGLSYSAFAGNPQRAGSAGGAELLINPWARAAGWNALNVANVRGVEASYVNIAGAAFTEKTDVGFSNTQYLVGGDISISAAGFNQAVGENGVLVANFVSFNYGEWTRTTESNPEGGIGTVSPSTAIIGLGYAQKFTEAIRGGVNIKIYSANNVDMSVTTAAIDAGVQYVTGAEEQIKFGITLKNVGPEGEFSGDGQSITLPVPQGNYTQAYDQRSAPFEIPATLLIGGSYDFLFTQQRLTVAGVFQSNSFEKDIYRIGAEYSMKEMLSARVGYTIFDNRAYEVETTVFTGFSGGISFDLPLSDNKQNVIGVDYSYQATRLFDGVHSFGIRFSL
jgi:hypothetical protein